jgi:hypothetical protein
MAVCHRAFFRTLTTLGTPRDLARRRAHDHLLLPADFETADALTAAVSQVRPEDWTYCGRMF